MITRLAIIMMPRILPVELIINTCERRGGDRPPLDHCGARGQHRLQGRKKLHWNAETDEFTDDGNAPKLLVRHAR
jgi:hypothetical protein